MNASFVSHELLGTQFPHGDIGSLKHAETAGPGSAQPDVGSFGQDLTAGEKRQAIDRAARLVERSFLNMHFVGGLRAATAYADARNTWALMLMTWGPCVPELNQGEH